MQVRAMKTIYQRAAHVMVCLGEGPGFLAFGLIRELQLLRQARGDTFTMNHVVDFHLRRETNPYLRGQIDALVGLLLTRCLH